MKECTAFPRNKQHWTWEGRQVLQRLWNANVSRGRKALSMRAFAESYRLSHGRLQRELKRGFTGVLLRDLHHGGWMYPEYSAEKAQAIASCAQREKGRRSVVTNHFVDRLIDFLSKGLSVGTCLYTLKQEGWEHLPSSRTVYYHLKEGVILLPNKRLRYRPQKKRHRKPLRKALILPERRSIEDRPKTIDLRSAVGHFEGDCIVSGRNGRGGLFVLHERKTRYTILRPLRRITQAAVYRALRDIVRDFPVPIHSLTLDNGTEFLNQTRLETIIQAPIYYTHAYAAWEKGSVEHVNGLVRFWFPKETNFAHITPLQVQHVQDLVNSISRPHTLKGLTAHEALTRLP